VTHLVISVALGYVLGQILWEFLLAAAGWAGKAMVIAFTSMLRLVMERKSAVMSRASE
jgi:hypothetical protein